MSKALLAYLLSFVSEHKQSLFKDNIEKRTSYLTVVLEDIYQPQNASAVLRTCDCFGLQDVYIIENQNEFQVNPDVTQGAAKWLSLHQFNQSVDNTTACFDALKKKGYQIVAMLPNKNSIPLEDISLEQKTALVFGTELTGLSEVALKKADQTAHLPMHGFTHSFNISVSAALSMGKLIDKLHKSEIQWQLTTEERTAVLLNWARNAVKRADLLEESFKTSH